MEKISLILLKMENEMAKFVGFKWGWERQVGIKNTNNKLW